jgi:hypothetical protein
MCNGAARGLACALAAAATLAWSAAPVQAQGLSLKGRVLDRAVRKPVPGATVRLISRTGPAAMTDDQGRFALDADVSAARVPPPLGELPTPPGRRTISPVPAWEASGAWRDAAGRIRAWGLPALGVKSGPGTNGSPAALAKAAAAESLEIACPGLVTRRVPIARDTADLGDIVLDYPPRRFDVGVKPIYGSVVLFDGTRARMDAEWEMWMGTYRKANGLGPTPLAWKFVADPVDSGMAMQTCCRAQWGDEDLVTKRKFRDFQLHVEFNLVAPRAGTTDPANSGVYLQSLYEIQIKDDYGLAKLGSHDMAGILNETAAPANLCRPKGKWQAYDITFRAARFQGGTRTEKARVTLYWNGKLVHKDKETANEHSTGISSDSLSDGPHGLKLQSEGHDVRFRNVWIKELDLEAPTSDVGY